MSINIEEVTLQIWDACKGRWLIMINGKQIGTHVSKSDGLAIINFLNTNKGELNG